MASIFKNIFYLVIALGLSACSVSKHLPDDQRVHHTTEIIFSNPDQVNKRNKVKAELLAKAQPKPAYGIKKFQTNLFNRLSKNQKQKGLKQKLKNKFGKPPVLFDQKRINRSELVMQKYMIDNGYFGASVKSDTLTNGKDIAVNYTIECKGQYKIRNITLPNDSISLAGIVAAASKKSLMISGEPYSQLILEAERNRLAQFANNAGYMNVNADHFYFFVDTTVTQYQVDIFLKIRAPEDESKFQIYNQNSNIVFSNYSKRNTTALDTTLFEGFKFIQKNEIIRPQVLIDIVQGKPEEQYNKTKQANTLNRLLELGIYKYVNIKYEQLPTDTGYYYNRLIYLTPALMQDFSSEFQVTTRSGNFFGVGLSGTYSHKNIFSGAERLDVTLSSAIETLANRDQNLVNTLDFGLTTSLSFPDFLVPFKTSKSSGSFLPRTKFTISDHFQRRTEFYSLNDFNLKFGYEWNELKDRRHKVYPFNISQIRVFNKTEDFFEILSARDRLRTSFENVFILGLTYDFIYNTIVKNSTQSFSYLRLGFETSGNIPSLISSTFSKNETKPYQLFKTTYSQFVRIDVDFRRFKPLKKGMLGAKFFGGVGVPYNNSTVLPFVKQFFVGGANSVRAYQIRQLGPGSYQNPDADDDDFLDQSGDIKLEASVEYRFPIFSALKGAVFVDAGNIWLIEDIENRRPEGLFRFNNFYKQIAVGTGLGLRLDFEYVVIRFDGSFPIRQPFVIDGNNWNFSGSNFSDRDWRRNNLAWHFAIGYPF